VQCGSTKPPIKVCDEEMEFLSWVIKSNYAAITPDKIQLNQYSQYGQFFATIICNTKAKTNMPELAAHKLPEMALKLW
jgi:hypothetical protein